MGAALAVLLTIAPWLVWFSFVTAPATTVVLGAVSLVCSFHGWGRIVARLAGRADADPALAMQWGVAAVVSLGGPMLALGIYEPRLLLLGGCAAHSLDLGLRFFSVRESLREKLALREVRFWIIPFAIVAVVAVVNTLAAAGQIESRPFDDDGHVVAQVHRLSTTGALSDPIGFARSSQLGGHIVLGGLTTELGDARLHHVIDLGCGLLLFLLLLCSRTRPRDAESAIWTSLLVVVMSSMQMPTDALPMWIPAGLILALYATLTTTSTEARAMLPIGLVAGALCALRTELAPASLAILAIVWWRDRQSFARDWRRIAVLVAPVVLVVACYAISRALAWSSVGSDAHAIFARSVPFSWKALLLFVLIASASVPFVRLVCRALEDRALQILALAATISVVAIATRLVGGPPLSTQLVWPILIAVVAALAISISAQPVLRRLAMVVAAFACILVVEAQTAPGRKSWSRQYSDLLADVEYARNLAAEPGPYDGLLARIPAGQRVAVWVTRPELLDYRRHEIIDLHTPRITKSVNLEKLVRGTHARWLLVDGAYEPKLANLVENARSQVNSQGIQLVELR